MAARINVNVGAITELLKLALDAGADIAKARAVLQSNNVDPAVYQGVIDDRRTFKDFHGANPQSAPAAPPVEQPTTGGGIGDGAPPAPPTQPPTTQPPTTGTGEYGKWFVKQPTSADGFQPGDHIYKRSINGQIQYTVDKKENGIAGAPNFEYFADVT